MTKCHSIAGRKRSGFTLVEIMIVVLIIGILLNIAAPSLITARNSSRAKACIANLKDIDSSKQQYIMDQKLASNFTFGAAWSDLTPTYIRKQPACPSGGTYTINNGTTNPTCSYAATDPLHTLTKNKPSGDFNTSSPLPAC